MIIACSGGIGNAGANDTPPRKSSFKKALDSLTVVCFTLRMSSNETARGRMYMLRIGDFSKLSMVSIRMLRHYDELGLLTPAVTDPFTAYRYYGEDQLAVAGRIKALKDMGFGLAAIGEIIRSEGDKSVLVQHLRIRQAELEEQSNLTARQLRLLQTAISRLGKDDINMSYSVILKELPDRYVASVRRVIPEYQQEGVLWKIMMEELAPLNLQQADPCYATAIFHDMEHKEADVDVEVQMAYKGIHNNTANVVFKTEPRVLVASATYTGSYEQMPAVNEAVASWIKDNGYEFCGAAFNIYHVSPYDTKNPDEFVTEVCYPVRKG